MKILMKDREHGITDPDKFRPYGKFFITNRNGVSWRNDDRGNRELNMKLANRNGIVLELGEWYTNEDTHRVIAKETMLELNRDEIKSMVEYMQRWLEMTGEPKMRFTEMVLVNDRWSVQATYDCTEAEAKKYFDRTVKQEKRLGQIDGIIMAVGIEHETMWSADIERKIGKPLSEVTLDELDLQGRSYVGGDHVADFTYNDLGVTFDIANGHGGHMYSLDVTREWLRAAGYEVGTPESDSDRLGFDNDSQ